MTKLEEWLYGGGILLASWFYLITSKDNINFVRDNYDFILYSPIIFIILFGFYAATIVLYRVYTFNDCEDAAMELQEEIVEAKEQLAKLGYNFQQKTK